MSLKLALEQLLGGRCYHMFETHERPADGDVWLAAGRGEMPDWNEFFADYVATVDWPSCDFWREQSDANPDALVLLSVRDECRRMVDERERDDLPVAAAHARSRRSPVLAGRVLPRPHPNVPRRARGQGLLRGAQHERARDRHGPTACSSTSRGAGGSRCAPRSDCRCPTRRTRTPTPPRSSVSAWRVGQSREPPHRSGAHDGRQLRSTASSTSPSTSVPTPTSSASCSSPQVPGGPAPRRARSPASSPWPHPIAQRTLRLVRTGSKAPIPAAKAAKYAAIVVPIGVQLSSTVRRGIRKLQALASFIIWRLRDEGIEPERAFVRALTSRSTSTPTGARTSTSAEPHRRITDAGVDPARHRHRLRGARVQTRPGVGRRARPPGPRRAGVGRPGQCGPSRAHALSCYDRVAFGS